MSDLSPAIGASTASGAETGPALLRPLRLRPGAGLARHRRCAFVSAGAIVIVATVAGIAWGVPTQMVWPEGKTP